MKTSPDMRVLTRRSINIEMRMLGERDADARVRDEDAGDVDAGREKGMRMM